MRWSYDIEGKKSRNLHCEQAESNTDSAQKIARDIAKQISAAIREKVAPDKLVVFSEFSNSCHDPRERYLHKCIMRCRQPLECTPVHPLGLPAFTIQDTGFPSEPVPDPVGASCCSIITPLPLTCIAQAVAVPTRKDACPT